MFGLNSPSLESKCFPKLVPSQYGGPSSACLKKRVKIPQQYREEGYQHAGIENLQNHQARKRFATRFRSEELKRYLTFKRFCVHSLTIDVDPSIFDLLSQKG